MPPGSSESAAKGGGLWPRVVVSVRRYGGYFCAAFIAGAFVLAAVATGEVWACFVVGVEGYSSFFMSFVPIRKANMKTIAWAVAAARVEFMFIVLP